MIVCFVGIAVSESQSCLILDIRKVCLFPVLKERCDQNGEEQGSLTTGTNENKVFLIIPHLGATDRATGQSQ